MKNKVEIGSVYKSLKSGDFKVLNRRDTKQTNVALYEIEFVLTGNKIVVNGSNLLKGKVKDNFYPRICGVACIGNVTNATKHPLYNTWSSMIKRCYDEKHRNYTTYGGAGVKVEDNWLIFENYIRDISQKENYDKLVNDKKNWNIDKDIICEEEGIYPKIYSNKTTLIINARNNCLNRQRDYTTTYEKDSKGVHCRVKNGGVEWCATIKDPYLNKQLKKYFSTNKYGECAKEMAIQQRKKWEFEIRNKKAREILEKTNEEFRKNPRGFLCR